MSCWLIDVGGASIAHVDGGRTILGQRGEWAYSKGDISILPHLSLQDSII